MSEPWPKDRRQELALLMELLRKCRELNRSSGCIGNLQRITELAEGLSRDDLENMRLSLAGWLRDQAVGE